MSEADEIRALQDELRLFEVAITPLTDLNVGELSKRSRPRD